MPVVFEFHRSIYLPPNPPSPPASATLTPGTEFVVPIGETEGNFFNWAGGGKNQDPFNTGGFVYNPLEAPVDGDDPSPSAFAAYPLRPNFASVEVWVRAYFGGTGWTSVTNIRARATSIDLTGYGSGAWLNGRIATQYPIGDLGLVDGFSLAGAQAFGGPHYLQPGTALGPPLSVMQQASLVGTSGSLDITPGDGVTPGSAYSKYLVLQLATGSSPTPGEGGHTDITVSYDES